MNKFKGFPPMNANFTPVPNAFFDYVLPCCPPCVVSVVGAIIRATLGWTDSVTGEKRIEAELSIPDIARRARIAENSARKGVRQALEEGLLVETAPAGLNTGARYALRWEDEERQKEAIERARRATGDQPAPPSNIAPPSEIEGVQLLTPSKVEPPYIKKSLFVKKSKDIDIKEKKSLIVSGEVDSKPEPVPEDGPANQRSTTEEETQIYQTEISEPVEEAIQLTQDEGSRRRWIQLRQLCLNHQATAAWSEALNKTRQRLVKGGVANAGAYLHVALLKALDARGVTVPTGTLEERDEVRGVIGASLGLSTE
jgi:hypothetical protein